MSSIISIGKVVSAFGIQGWVKIITESPPDNLNSYRTVQIGSNTYNVLDHFIKGRLWHVRLEKVDTRNLADMLVGQIVAINRNQLPVTDTDEYYWADLIGLTVINQQNQALGQVIELMDAPAHSILIVKGEKQYMIPFVGAYILQVNIADKVIRVDWGLDY